jgi:phosphotransferase system enzyme I (PtsI)
VNAVQPAGERTYSGIAAAGGVVHAKVLVLGHGHAEVPERELSESEVGVELERFRQALVDTRHELQAIQRQVSSAMGAKEADIFEAHLLVLDDPTLLDEVSRGITERRRNAEASFHEVAGKYAAALAAVDDDYLRERAADVRDVEQRVLNNLLGVATASDLANLLEPVIVVAPDLSPSTTAVLDRTKVLGFATDGGGKTSHTAIMARKLRIPAVVGLGEATRQVRSGEYALLDGHSGLLIVNPTDATLFQYGQIRERRAAFEQRLRDLRDQPAVTFDGTKLILAANIDDPADSAAVKEAGAEGVGLFRTEFLFLKSATAPDEESQFRAYRDAAAALAPAPVVIRTLDLGGDKLPGEGAGHREENPFLGWRAIRISLDQPAAFKQQLRAILRASAHGNVKLMYPMISSVDELLAANEILDECRGELRGAGVPFDERMEVGMMIEVPSAALIAPLLAPHVNFFSFGTNDLTQYTLAVDRMNERVAHLHQVTHPGVLRLMQMTIEAAREHGRWVGVCGEAAGDPAVIPLFVGLGVQELSATPAVVPAAKFLLRRLKVNEAKAMTEEALKLGTSTAVYARSLALAKQVAPELFPG